MRQTRRERSNPQRMRTRGNLKSDLEAGCTMFVPYSWPNPLPLPPSASLTQPSVPCLIGRTFYTYDRTVHTDARPENTGEPKKNQFRRSRGTYGRADGRGKRSVIASEDVIRSGARVSITIAVAPGEDARVSPPPTTTTASSRSRSACEQRTRRTWRRAARTRTWCLRVRRTAVVVTMISAVTLRAKR